MKHDREQFRSCDEHQAIISERIMHLAEHVFHQTRRSMQRLKRNREQVCSYETSTRWVSSMSRSIDADMCFVERPLQVVCQVVFSRLTAEHGLMLTRTALDDLLQGRTGTLPSGSFDILLDRIFLQLNHKVSDLLEAEDQARLSTVYLCK